MTETERNRPDNPNNIKPRRIPYKRSRLERDWLSRNCRIVSNAPHDVGGQKRKGNIND